MLPGNIGTMINIASNNQREEGGSFLKKHLRFLCFTYFEVKKIQKKGTLAYQ